MTIAEAERFYNLDTKEYDLSAREALSKARIDII